MIDIIVLRVNLTSTVMGMGASSRGGSWKYMWLLICSPVRVQVYL